LHVRSISLACGAYCFMNKSGFHHIFFIVFLLIIQWCFSSFLFCLPIHWWRKWFELQYSGMTTTQLVPNSTKKRVKWQPFVKSNLEPSEIQIAQHQFNSKTVLREVHLCFLKTG